eukprot:TRINITY_DN2834_c0_g1::TRINITY_DN2834_c0_g1_i1::g.5250::m.5250 TRINITY_DN2834_c0_g1::TRINITY_DN2834_c0_g1_i1::g.5250  ORF type:complete len:712 (-),score=291.81,sp/Q5T9A4/ATD3B_HUMAN/30.69/1e-08,AAA/PF00004.24/1.1e-17,AAA_19/PF13245.1/2.4e-05,AAA_22/PF13401.1/57,AAA_22/PF13401.1/0.0075,AAA_22/PF13401.1/17,AAA_5/PF07728.9/0.00071,AAA_16/PF13191.1/3.3e+03,AAA_16/PF13191.1/0.00053,AAA_16/PF13191.1/8.9e+02,AAA_16/PF13191.1/4e+03,AAA_17/PF13207.1/2.8e+03,AAA_17/PF13207.1/0.0037,Vps36_ESCRT-II/PF11605.
MAPVTVETPTSTIETLKAQIAASSATSPSNMDSSTKRWVVNEVGNKEPVGFLNVTPSQTIADLRTAIEEQLSESAIVTKGFAFSLQEENGKLLPMHKAQESQLAWPLLDSLKIRKADAARLAVLSVDDLKALQTHIENELENRDKAEEDNGEEGKGEEGNEEDKEDKVKRFEVVREDKRSCTGEKYIITYLRITDRDLVTSLRDVISHDALWNTVPKIASSDLIEDLQTLKSQEEPMFKALITFLEVEHKEMIEKATSLKAEGKITYDTLDQVFSKGGRIVTTVHDEQVGAEVEAVQYHRGWSSYFEVRGVVIRSDGRKFFSDRDSWIIPPFKGPMNIRDLPVQPLSDEVKATLEARGRLFRKIAKGAHYLHYTGSIARHSYWCSQMFRADGRVMVDPVSFRRCNPNYNFKTTDDQSKILQDIPEEKLYQTWPTVHGFSFTSKKWGEISVSRVTEIKFDDDAYDRLVLDAKKKKLVQALVQNSDFTFSDVIQGKGGGCIFLLHGAPGTGKTLTAEAIAELLHRPLYSVSVGELGVTTAELETRLREILEVAQSWHAVLLIDEADIFLERRTENDIQRNAMVGIFLRLLEYHQGVLFLTTNRVSCFDEAFHSRISVALKYEALSREAREHVWINLLDAAGITGLDPKALSEFDINGRQIKTTIRLAQSLARSEGVEVNADFIRLTVEVAQQFQSDILLDKEKAAANAAALSQ